MRYTSRLDKEVYDEGYKSAKEGVLISYCPYTEEDRVYKYFWLGGYNDYKLERGL